MEFIARASAYSAARKEPLNSGMARQSGVLDVGRFQATNFLLQGTKLFLSRSGLGGQGEGNHRAIFEHMFDYVNVH